MNPKITLFILFAVPLFCMAQSPLARQYSYDAAGNRTACAVITLPSPTPPAPPDSTETPNLIPETSNLLPHTPDLTPQTSEYFVEKIAQTEIKIYPNPTTEKITLEFLHGGVVETHGGVVETQCIASLRLYSLSGQLLQEQSVHSAKTVISLAGKPAGVYILKVNVNGITEDWKIIKNWELRIENWKLKIKRICANPDYLRHLRAEKQKNNH